MKHHFIVYIYHREMASFQKMETGIYFDYLIFN